jgi:hypothetical protein
MKKTIPLVLGLVVGFGLTVKGSDCSKTGIGLPTALYQRDAAHEVAGLVAAQAIVPLDASGLPDPTGRIGMVTIGMSNAAMIYNKWSQVMLTVGGGDKDRHPAFRIIKAALSGKTAESWSVQTNNVWATAKTRTIQAGLTIPQVQAAAVMMTQKYPRVVYSGSTGHPMTEAQVRAVIDNLVFHFPNVRVVYLSGLNYTGYSDDPALSFSDRERAPEPYVHNDSILLASLVTSGGFPVWVDFTDLWADGVTPNPLTGLSYACGDVAVDGVHPSKTGGQKLGYFLRDRWEVDPVTRGWMFK